MNNINFTGNLGGDAEQKILADGTSIVSMNVPCKSGFGDKAITTWLRCSLFGPRFANLMPHLVKGSLVGITGEFSAREYTDRDGQKKKRYHTCGKCFTDDQGRQSIKLDAIPGPGWSGWLSLYPVEKQAPRQQPDPRPPRAQLSPEAEADQDDDIPF